MRITCQIPLRSINQDEFAQMDYRVMRCAFDSQNELGRLCDEAIYQNDLADRLQAAGLGPVRKEVPVTATYRDFAKTYWLDLVVGDAGIYEPELRALLHLSPLRAIQWINLARHRVQFVTLEK